MSRIKTFFGASAEVNINGKRSNTTALGIFLTAALFGVCIACSVIFGRELVEKSYPLIIPSVINKALVNEAIPIDPKNISFFVSTNTNYTFWRDDSIYYFEAYYFRITKTYINIIPCETTAHDISTGTKWCFDPSPENVAKLNLGNPDMGRLTVRLYKCNNATSKVTCKSPEEIDRVLASSFVGISLKDVSVNASNYLEPLTEVWSHQPKSMMLTNTKLFNLYLKGVEFTTDYGWAISDKRTVKGIGIESMTNDFGPLSAYGGALYAFQIFNGGNLYTYQRSYTKIQDVLAQISGVMSTLVIIASVIGTKYSSFKMYERLMKETYDTKPKKDKLNFKRSTIALKRSRSITNRDFPSEAVSLEMVKFESQKNRENETVSNDQNHHLKGDDGSGSGGGGEESSNYSERMTDEVQPTQADVPKMKDPALYIPKRAFPAMNKQLTGDSFLAITTSAPLKTNPIESPTNGSGRFPLSFTFEPSKFNRTATQKLTGIPPNDIVSSREMSIGSPTSLKGTTGSPNKEDVLQDNVQRPPQKENMPENSLPIQEESEENETQESQQGRVSYWHWLCSPFKSTKSKISLVKLAKQKFKQNLDVVIMAKKFAQLDHLAYLLLNEEQKFVLENLPKPLLQPPAEQKEKNSAKKMKEKVEERKEMAEKIIKGMTTKNEPSAVDIKLTNLYYGLRNGSYS